MSQEGPGEDRNMPRGGLAHLIRFIQLNAQQRNPMHFAGEDEEPDSELLEGVEEDEVEEDEVEEEEEEDGSYTTASNEDEEPSQQPETEQQQPPGQGQ